MGINSGMLFSCKRNGHRGLLMTPFGVNLDIIFGKSLTSRPSVIDIASLLSIIRLFIRLAWFLSFLPSLFLWLVTLKSFTVHWWLTLVTRTRSAADCSLSTCDWQLALMPRKREQVASLSHLWTLTPDSWATCTDWPRPIWKWKTHRLSGLLAQVF